MSRSVSVGARILNYGVSLRALWLAGEVLELHPNVMTLLERELIEVDLREPVRSASRRF